MAVEIFVVIQLNAGQLQAVDGLCAETAQGETGQHGGRLRRRRGAEGEQHSFQFCFRRSVQAGDVRGKEREGDVIAEKLLNSRVGQQISGSVSKFLILKDGLFRCPLFRQNRPDRRFGEETAKSRFRERSGHALQIKQSDGCQCVGRQIIGVILAPGHRCGVAEIQRSP